MTPRRSHARRRTRCSTSIDTVPVVLAVAADLRRHRPDGRRRSDRVADRPAAPRSTRSAGASCSRPARGPRRRDDDVPVARRAGAASVLGLPDRPRARGDDLPRLSGADHAAARPVEFTHRRFEAACLTDRRGPRLAFASTLASRRASRRPAVDRNCNVTSIATADHHGSPTDAGAMIDTIRCGRTRLVDEAAGCSKAAKWPPASSSFQLGGCR